VKSQKEEVEVRRKLKWLLPLVGAIALGAVVAACGGGGGGGGAATTAAPPPATSAATETGGAAETTAATTAAAACPADDGVINIFAAADVKSAKLGQNISPAGFDRMAGLWLDKTNSEGGVLGCQIKFDVKEDGFDIPTCIRLYKEAIQSNQYDVFMGPTNSGCMAGLPALTGAAGKWLMSGIAADHEPFFTDPAAGACKAGQACFKPPYYISHSSVSTFLEGRTVAYWASKQGYKAPALMVPNYAYGQDVQHAFEQEFKTLVPDGSIVDEEFPEFNETNFTPFINKMIAKSPDMILTAFFSSFLLPFMTQWQASGNDSKIPVVSGLFSLDAQAGVKKASQIPQNWYGYDRGNEKLLENNPVAKTYIDLWNAKYGSQYPAIDSFPFQILSSLQELKALVEKTQSLDPATWKTAIEAGDFSFDGPYNSGPTYVDPVNHMADTCAEVGKITFDTTLGQAAYDPNSFVLGCMHDLIPMAEAEQLTSNPDVSPDAIAKYQQLSGTK
jgi:ABC-type branched-subunit amino acid transport system substrate-binding protein